MAMHNFSIGDIEVLTGIKAHTLHTWEKRYKFLEPSRIEGRQRFYSNIDLQKLLCISILHHSGWKISKIASLRGDEAIAIASSGLDNATANYKVQTLKFLSAAIEFNESYFLQLLNELIDKIGFEKAIAEICYPYLQIGALLWNANNVISPQQHFSSYLVQNRVISETEKLFPAQQEAPEIILFCPEKEANELPLLFINYMLRKYKWKVLYLGTNIKLIDLKKAVEIKSVEYLYIHLITSFTGVSIDDYFETLRKTFAGKKIIASGKGIENSQRHFVNLSLLKTDTDIYHFIKSKS